MSDPLYYNDPTALEFSATVVAISDDIRTVVLDRTLFYPEGGGQPADTGTIHGFTVTDVQKNDDGTIVHTLAGPNGQDTASQPALAEGATVTGIIDWDHRFEYMQQHTGQHVLSGALLEVAGAGTVSVAQGSEFTSIEIDTDALNPDQIDEVVDRANEVIREDLEVIGFWIDDGDLASYDLRRPTKRKGRIRLVQIGTAPFDLVACGGVHLPRTGLLNLVEIVATERIRGHQRLHFKIGDRALAHYRSSHRTLSTVSELFSTHPSDLPTRVRQEIESGQELRRTVRLQKERIAGFIVDAAESSAGSEQGALLIEIALTEEDTDLFKAVAENAANRTGGDYSRYVAVHIVDDAVHWAIAIGATPFPAEQIRTNVLAPFGAKGGGKPPLWRGVIPAAAAESARGGDAAGPAVGAAGPAVGDTGAGADARMTATDTATRFIAALRNTLKDLPQAPPR